MVLPGWNVTEPIQAAISFYNFVKKLQDAPESIRSFASQTERFSDISISIDELASNQIPTNSLEQIKRASLSFKKCAEDCQGFIQKFFNDNGRSLGSRARWIWENERASKLEERMKQEINNVQIYLTMETLYQFRDVITSTAASSENPSPLTPGALLGLDTKASNNQGLASLSVRNSSVSNHPNPFVVDTPGLSDWNADPCDRQTQVQDSRQPSLTNYLPLEILQRRGSNNLRPPSLETTMDNLHGVSLFSKIGCEEPRRVHKIELLQDTIGNTHYMIITLHTEPKTMIFQRLQQVPRPIPHSEHPAAYRNKTVYRIKFLHHLQTPSQSYLSSRQSMSGSSATPSDQDFILSSSYESPNTPLSSYMISPKDIGSPQLPASSVKVIEEGDLPTFEFKLKADYDKFQEILMGRGLLANVPIETIVTKSTEKSELLEEAQNQYLRLWKHGRSQIIMYYANLRPPFGIYVEHDIECFQPSESKSNSLSLVLEVKCSKMSTTDSPKKRGSFTSKMSSPLSFRRESKSGKETDNKFYGEDLPDTLRNVKSLTIKFTHAKDKVLFLEKASFYGTPDGSMIPPFQFQSWSP